MKRLETLRQKIAQKIEGQAPHWFWNGASRAVLHWLSEKESSAEKPKTHPLLEYLQKIDPDGKQMIHPGLVEQYTVSFLPLPPLMFEVYEKVIYVLNKNGLTHFDVAKIEDPRHYKNQIRKGRMELAVIQTPGNVDDTPLTYEISQLLDIWKNIFFDDISYFALLVIREYDESRVWDIPLLTKVPDEYIVSVALRVQERLNNLKLMQNFWENLIKTDQSLQSRELEKPSDLST